MKHTIDRFFLIGMAAQVVTAHAAAEWKTPAVFDLTTRVIAPDPGGWTATMGTMPGANNLMLGGGFEQIHRRTLVVPNADAADTVPLDYSTMTEWDTYAEPYMDGAKVRVYRLINGAFKLVRRDSVPPGGARASGWIPQASIKPGVTEYRFAFPSWQRPDQDYLFTVKAIDSEGNESGISNVIPVRPPGKGGESLQITNETVNFSPVPVEDRSERQPPAAPRGLRIKSVDQATGLITLAWDASPDADLAAYQIQLSNTDPAKHRGYGLDLAGRAKTEEEKIRRGDFVFLEINKENISRKRDWSPRVWGTFAVAPPANLTFHPDEDPLKTWAFVPHSAPVPAEFTDLGEKCLKVTVKDGAVAEAAEWKFGARNQDYLMVLEVGKPIVVEVWLRKERATDDVTFEFDASGHGWQPALPLVFKPTDKWRKYSAVITPTTEYTSDIAGQVKWRVSGKGSVYLDNLRVYYKDRPFMAPPAEDVAALRKSRLHAIRTHAFIKSGSSYSMKSLLGGPGETNIGGDDTLGNQLKLFAEIGTNPWLQVELHMSPEEWAGLVEYLAAPYDPAKGDTPAKKPWAAMRYKQGQTKPWSEVFQKFYFEISNETWNPPFAPWTFINRSMTDAATGRTYGGGELYGLWQNQVNACIKASPYWPALAPKWEVVLGGWNVSGGEDGYGQAARKLCPDARHVTTAPYNGGWDEGAIPVSADDKGRFLALTFTPQRGDVFSRELAADAELLRAKGHPFTPGTYEAGPGYALPGTVNAQQIEAEAQVMKSLAGGTATLDAFLNAATHGFQLQNLFVYGRGRGFWSGHASLQQGGQPYPWWRACTELYNTHGTGDFLQVETISTPTWDLPATPTRPALADAPMAAVYATRKGDRFNVFVISRKLDGYPVAGDDGYTPVTIKLPFKSAAKVTLRRMTGDPRVTNLDADNVKIQEGVMPAAAFDPVFKLNKARGADDRGLPPGSTFMYVFEGCRGIAESPPAPPVLTRQPADVTAKEGFAATFEATVQAAHPRHFLVQWQRQRGQSWEDVPGAVTPRLQFAELSAADDGAVFRCRVTDPLLKEPLLSKTATLRVQAFDGPVFQWAANPPSAAAGEDPVWATATAFPLNFLPDAAKVPAATATVRGLWDDQNLYLLIEATDADVQSSAGRAWSGDGVEVFLDLRNSKTAKYGPEHYQFYCGFTGGARPEYAGGSSSARLAFSKLRGKSRKTGGGWVQELAIPWSELAPRKGGYLGLDVVLIDRGAAGDSLKRTLADSKGQGWQNPTVFGTAKLAKP
jgi:hypothetical protein